MFQQNERYPVDRLPHETNPRVSSPSATIRVPPSSPSMRFSSHWRRSHCESSQPCHSYSPTAAGSLNSRCNSARSSSVTGRSLISAFTTGNLCPPRSRAQWRRYESSPPRPPNRFRVALEVRRVPLGPGLRPGSCRQVRRGGRGSGAQGWVPKILSAERLERIFGCPDAGGAAPDNARRSGPVSVTFHTAISTSRRQHDGPASSALARSPEGALEPVPPACGGGGQPTGGSAAPGGLPPVGRGRLPARSRRVPPAGPLGSGGSPLLQLAFPLG